MVATFRVDDLVILARPIRPGDHNGIPRTDYGKMARVTWTGHEVCHITMGSGHTWGVMNHQLDHAVGPW